MKILPVRGSFGPLLTGGVVSPGCTSRHSSTCFTPMLSSAHPVTATDPASTEASPAGVSKLPNGSDGAAVVGTTARVTAIGAIVLFAPVSCSVIVPVAVPDAGSDGSNFTATVIADAPEPDAGETVSHGLSAVAVHVTAAPVVCVRR